jgi:REP element-mobilizing transposase RayT
MAKTTSGGFKLSGPWRSRGYLPHFDGDQIPQFVTYRLAGTLPRKILVQYKQQLERGLINEIEYHELVDEYLDRNCGESFLRLSKIAEMIEENLLRFDEVKYKLHAWVVMPNHVHVLFTSINEYKLSSIIHSAKSYTATQANKLLERSGDFWAREYFDRYIRNADHFVNTVNYIHSNPVKAGLCSNAKDWPFSSARLFTGE